MQESKKNGKYFREKIGEEKEEERAEEEKKEIVTARLSYINLL